MSVRDDFENYCYWVDRLREEELVSTGWENTHSLNWKKGDGMTLTVTQPEETRFRSLLVALRRFISPDDPVFLNRIYNLCELNITSDELKNYLRDARAKWKEAQKSNGMKLVFNDKELTPAHLADLWINGHYFHGSITDPKTRELQSLGILGYERFNFVGFVGDTVGQVLYVDSIIRHALRDGALK